MVDSQKLNLEGFTSPGCSVILLKFNDLPSTLGGVPVFILPDEKPLLIKTLVSPTEDFSPDLPPLKFFSPICMRPFKKVPFVKITEVEWIFVPKEVITPEILLPSKIRSTTIS